MFLLAPVQVVAASLKGMHFKARCEVHLLLQSLPRSISTGLRALSPPTCPSPPIAWLRLQLVQQAINIPLIRRHKAEHWMISS